MTLRRRFLLYIFALHIIFAGGAIWFLRTAPLWLIAVEGLYVLSLALGLRLVKNFFQPLDLIRSGALYLREGEFTTRFRPTGQSDMDQLIEVYNRMADSLREERVRNEEQEHLLGRVLAESPGGVITLDVEDRIATANPTAVQLLKIPVEGLVGRRLDELGSAFADQLADLSNLESQVYALRGRSRVRCQAATFMDRGFSRRFLLLDEMTDELHQSEKQAYEKLVRLMSHEVNNTSGAVQSLLQSCLNYGTQLTADDRHEFVRALEVAIQRTANLDAFMRSFAEVVRLPRPQLQPADPWEIAEQVCLLFRNRGAEAGVTWHREVESGLPRISCDPVQLEQALVNVIKNAVEAVGSTGESGEIVVRGGRRGSRLFLAVCDTGPGLSPDEQAQLFTPFFTTRANGQGIGLTMVQEILLAHGFDFSLENRDQGGAEFLILF